jgi:hypothetical protein
MYYVVSRIAKPATHEVAVAIKDPVAISSAAPSSGSSLPVRNFSSGPVAASTRDHHVPTASCFGTSQIQYLLHSIRQL